MKKLLIILLLSFLLFSCKEECKKSVVQTPSLYKKGDVVYLKPDSVRAVITYVNAEHYPSGIKYTYNVDFYLMSKRYQDSYVDTVYFYNNKKLKK